MTSTDSPEPDLAAARLVGRLVGGEPAADADLLAAAPVSTDVGLLVAAGVLTGDRAHLIRAGRLAKRPRDRQLVALGRAYVDGRSDLFDALVRDHLASHPGHVLAAWLAARHP